MWWGILAPILFLLVRFLKKTQALTEKHIPVRSKIVIRIRQLATATFVSITFIFLGSIPLAFADPQIVDESFNLIGLMVYFHQMTMDFGYEFLLFLLGVFWLILIFTIYVRSLQRGGIWLGLYLAAIFGAVISAFIWGEIVALLIFASIPLVSFIWDGVYLAMGEELPE